MGIRRCLADTYRKNEYPFELHLGIDTQATLLFPNYIPLHPHWEGDETTQDQNKNLSETMYPAYRMVHRTRYVYRRFLPLFGRRSKRRLLKPYLAYDGQNRHSNSGYRYLNYRRRRAPLQ
jgi:hypothetical protein